MARKIVDEMGLVEVTELQGEIRPVPRFTSLEPLDPLVQAIALDDPSTTDANGRVKDSLAGTVC